MLCVYLPAENLLVYIYLTALERSLSVTMPILFRVYYQRDQSCGLVAPRDVAVLTVLHRKWLVRVRALE